ncbi:YggS family pyridoxal phosphate-dependent enzyme [Allostreptomyces psammosilenae]|uniref:YggS family pyridoxal phosphate-dependent enzyme n=1 Tax=Allostreptomyces psammosilenae TaxID=1892865 RepID=UPI0015CD0E37|nr:YggS family pyridoxal phosphate-dependent enzyme [Allostreptomyces psammosilenae]
MRARELEANLALVRSRIAAAERAAGRPAGSVRLVVITKTHPARDVRILSSLGVTDVGENRLQEAAPKVESCSDLELTWHFVGQLQTNKVRQVVEWAGYVHSVDRSRLVDALSAAAVRAGRDQPGRELGCLIQVNLDPDPGRGGVDPDGVPSLADAVAGAPGLRLDGVMAVAPLRGPYAGNAAAAFDRVADIASRMHEAHPTANMVSAGMSADLEEAVAAGATHVRIGSAVLGVRKPLG